MKQLWVIADGEYSSYGVTAVATSREKAEALTERLGGYVDGTVTLFEDDDELPPWVTRWDCRIDERGSESTKSRQTTEFYGPPQLNVSKDLRGAVFAYDFPSQSEAEESARAKFAEEPDADFKLKMAQYRERYPLLPA